MLELARRVERVDIDDDEAGAQDRRDRDGVLRHVGHHRGDTVTALQTEPLKVSRQRPRGFVHLGEADGLAHELVGFRVLVLGEALLEQSHQGAVLLDVDRGRNACRVLLQPDLVHRPSSCATDSRGATAGAALGSFDSGRPGAATIRSISLREVGVIMMLLQASGPEPRRPRLRPPCGLEFAFAFAPAIKVPADRGRRRLRVSRHAEPLRRRPCTAESATPARISARTHAGQDCQQNAGWTPGTGAGRAPAGRRSRTLRNSRKQA
jgi:hypothetical protein